MLKNRRTYAAFERWIRIYDDVLRLRRDGLSYKDITERIYRLYRARLYKPTISRWVNGFQEPLTRVNKFDPRPSPELAGVIGVVLSDGNRYLHGGYRIRLSVKDRDYAEAFGQDLAKVLRKKKPYEPRWSRSQQHWSVTGYSILLFKHLDMPLQKLKPSIEANRTCVARFLRRFFDGEASIYGRNLTLYNTNRKVLVYIQQLLRRYFGIETTALNRNVRAGYSFRDHRTGKIYQAKKTCFRLYIRVHSLPLFHRYVGFTIKRKQQRLIQALR